MIDWCIEHLGSPVAERTLTAGNVSVVHGLRLMNGREVVLKIREEDERLGACTWVQRRMWQAGFPCPEPLAGPLPLGLSCSASTRYVLATDGLCPLRLPVGMIRSGWICSADSPSAMRRSTVCSMSSAMTGGLPPYLPLRASVSSVESRMFSRSVSAIAAKKPNREWLTFSA
ncbi:hypothetical protein ACIBJF_37360 [Streptomyces sp. NPDC050743]|uniref:hypothetical protein n=1 Tax=Streptomyces sp. NPDC050743 TaxID=3365634 RepID=UPI003798B7F3